MNSLFRSLVKNHSLTLSGGVQGEIVTERASSRACQQSDGRLRAFTVMGALGIVASLAADTLAIGQCRYNSNYDKRRMHPLNMHAHCHDLLFLVTIVVQKSASQGKDACMELLNTWN